MSDNWLSQECTLFSISFRINHLMERSSVQGMLWPYRHVTRCSSWTVGYSNVSDVFEAVFDKGWSMSGPARERYWKDAPPSRVKGRGKSEGREPLHRMIESYNRRHVLQFKVRNAIIHQESVGALHPSDEASGLRVGFDLRADWCASLDRETNLLALEWWLLVLEACLPHRQHPF